MYQMPLFQPLSSTVTVAELTRYIRARLEEDEALHDLWVQGEVSNLSRPSSGHMYFTLKDEDAALRCVMWRQNVSQLLTLPQNGDAVEVHGYISVYEAGGQYQLYVDEIRPLGEGLLYQQFLQLKARLEAEGLFAPERKRATPRYPDCIGLVTSPTGAALRDILNTLRRRYPLARAVLAPTRVQGDEAPAEIVAAIEGLNEVARPDVILVARGGGSIEDLWAFNDERVARAITASEAPVICGVGHETDFTIADFCADVRAPTPTAAAELATPDREELRAAIAEAHTFLHRTVHQLLIECRRNVRDLHSRLLWRSPEARLRSDRQRLDEWAHRIHLSLAHTLRLRSTQLEAARLRLATVNPENVLARGFAVVSHPDGRVVRAATDVRPGDPLNVEVRGGAFGVRVRDPAEPHPDEPPES